MTRESVNNSSFQAGALAEAVTLGLQAPDATVELKVCRACASEVRPRDRYCRRCGGSQIPILLSSTESLAAVGLSGEDSSFVTAPLNALAAENDVYHSVSGSLVRVITAGLSGSASAQLDSRYARRAVLALISIPIWLIIVLLSPLDAYATARMVIKQP